MFSYLEAILLSFAGSMPLPIFAGVASFAEEVIAPIPSGVILLLIGTLASVQEYTAPMILTLAVIASTGKLLGALVLYVIADKTEDFATARFSRYLGVTHKDIEKFGARFGKGWKDYALLIILRTVPIVPSALISLGAGVLRLRMRLFIIATFVGSIIRDTIFIAIGYAGLHAAQDALESLSGYESMLQIGVAIGLCLGGGIYLYLQTRNRRARLGR